MHLHLADAPSSRGCTHPPTTHTTTYTRTRCTVPFRVRIPHNNTIRTVERSLLAADTDGYANAKSGTVRDCAGKSSGKGYRDTSTSHSHSLSSRSLGGLDGAAALPGATACGRQSYGSLEDRRQCEAIHGGGKACCFRCCAQDSAKGFGGPSLPYGPKLILLTYTTGGR